MRFHVIGGGRRSIEVKADPNEGPLDIYEVLDNWFDRERVPPTNIDFLSMTFAVRLPHTEGRQRHHVLPGFEHESRVLSRLALEAQRPRRQPRCLANPTNRP